MEWINVEYKEGGEKNTFILKVVAPSHRKQQAAKRHQPGESLHCSHLLS